MKKILLLILSLIVVAVLYWLVSPLWRVVKTDDPAPVSVTTPTPVPSAPRVQEVPSKVPSKEKEMTVPQTTNTIVTKEVSGNFLAKAHDVSGRARVIETSQGKVLRFEDFDTVNGPDLRIYLATDDTAKDFIDLGTIQGTKGNSNYDIPQGSDLKKYSHVLVWCKSFSVLFSSAVLK